MFKPKEISCPLPTRNNNEENDFYTRQRCSSLTQLNPQPTTIIKTRPRPEKPGRFLIFSYTRNCILCKEYKIARIIEENSARYIKTIENTEPYVLFIEIKLTRDSIYFPKTFYVELKKYIKQHHLYTEKKIKIQNTKIQIHVKNSDNVFKNIIEHFINENNIITENNL